MPEKIQFHWQLDVYKLSVETAMEIFQLSKSFPKEEMYSLTDQVRRSSRGVSGLIAEGWRRRKYTGAFVDKMNQAEAEAAETQAWLEYGAKCEYLSKEIYTRLHHQYQEIIGKLIKMGNHPEQWCLKLGNS